MTDWIISSSILMLIVIGLRAVLKGRVSLRLQYALWLLVLVRLLVPVNFTESALSVLSTAERAMETPAMQTVTEFAQVHPPVQSFDEAYAQVVARYEASGVDVDTLTGSDLEALDYEAYEQMRSDVSIGEMVGSGLTILWVAGMAVTALCLLMTNLRFGLRLRRSRRELPVPGCALPVYVTGAVDTPCLFGLPKPAIYLPADTPWDEAAMEHILTHERTHYRHGDHIWAALRCVCLAVHWYNPLVWVCAGLSRRDGELACDEASIRVLGEAHRAAYGRTLIDMTCQKPRGMVGLTATTMNYSAKSLKERIVLIARRPRTAIYTLLLVLAIVVLLVGCTFTGTPEEPTEPVPPQAADEPSYYQGIIQTYSGYHYYRVLEREFSTPEEMDFYHFFSFGLGDPEPWNSLTTEERQFLLEQGFQAGQAVPKMTPEQIDAQLQLYFGLTLEEMRDELGLVYYDQTDCYYSVFQATPSDWFIAVIDCEVLDDHTVRVYYLPWEAVSAGQYEQDPETGKYYYEGVMALTLRETNEIPQIVANERIPAAQVQLDEPLPTQPREELPSEVIVDPTEPENPTGPETTLPAEPVDDEQLAVYQTLFEWTGKMIHARAAGQVYTTPSDVDLSYVFYNGVDYPGDWTTISESEKDFLLAEGFWDEGDIQIMPADLLEAELQWYFGVGLADVQIPEEWAYSPETDTYYSNHNDAYVTLATVTGYTQLDNETVVLHLIVDMVHDHDWENVVHDAAMDMTIRPYEGGGQILSNVPAE